MRCFERLVESHFLADVSAELRLARQIIRSMSQFDFKPSLITDKRRKKAIYNQVVQGYGLLSEIKAGFDEADSDKDTIFYFHLNELIFIYSRNLKQVSEALRYSYNNNGDIPLYRSRHRVDNITVHTALIDTRLQFKPAAAN